MKYRFTGGHSDTLDDGRTVEPGGFVEVKDVSTENNARLVSAGLLIEVPADKPVATKTTTKKEGDS